MNSENNEEMKLLSIIIPSYNHEQYVLDCLNSIQVQMYPYIEVIIVDDCSSDSTFQLERSWMEDNKKKYSNVILCQNEHNMGVVKTFNKGLSLCKGDYIIRLASDDCLLPDAVQVVVDIYSKNPEYAMICFDGGVGETYQNESAYLEVLPSMYGDVDYNLISHPFEELYKEDYIAAPGCVIKKETYDELGFYDEKSCIDDWEYYLRIMKSKPVLLSKERIVFFRQVADSLSHSPSINKRKMMNQGTLYVMEKYKNDVAPNISKETMRKKTNLILREVLEWDEPEYLEYVLQYMKNHRIQLSIRAYIKMIINRILHRKPIIKNGE